MSEIAILRDKEGRVHHTARDSKFAVEGLVDGSLVDVQKEADDAAANAKNGDDHNAGPVSTGPSDGKREAGASVAGDSEGVAKPAPRC